MPELETMEHGGGRGELTSYPSPREQCTRFLVHRSIILWKPSVQSTVAMRLVRTGRDTDSNCARPCCVHSPRFRRIPFIHHDGLQLVPSLGPHSHQPALCAS